MAKVQKKPKGRHSGLEGTRNWLIFAASIINFQKRKEKWQKHMYSLARVLSM